LPFAACSGVSTPLPPSPHAATATSAVNKTSRMRRAYCEIVTAVRVLLLLVAMSATAAADPVSDAFWNRAPAHSSFAGDSWLELGAMRARIAMPGGHEVQGYALSFSPRLPLKHHLYAGAELDRGDVSGSISTPAAFRESGGNVGPTSDVVGNYTSVRMLLGVRARTGVISAGGELAAGFYREQFNDPLGVQLATVEANSTQLEARARMDLWLTPQISLGAMVGADNHQDLTAGLILGLHIGHYDDGSAPVR
jgi:hypothetical protein